MNSLRFEFEAIGTLWVIDIYESSSRKEEDSVLSEVKKFIYDFDCIYSRFNKSSLITQISQNSGEYRFPKSADKLFSLCRRLYDLTDGNFTPLIGNLMESAGYDADYSLKRKKLFRPLDWDEAIDYSSQVLTVKKPVLLDFGALGKGYLVDLVADFLREKGFRYFCVDAGGDIYYSGRKENGLKIGLEHPGNTKQVIGIANILNRSICGSSGNRRKWGDLHHIISPKTLNSVNDVLAVWVVADTAILADGLATCLFLDKPNVFRDEFEFEYLRIFPDYSINKSENFPAEIYYNKN